MAPAFGEDDPGILFIRPANLFIRPGHGPVEFGYCLGFYKPTATPQSDGVLTHSEVLETLGLAFVAVIFRHWDLNPGRPGESRVS